MPFLILNSSDIKVNLMSLHVFLTLQIPISNLTLVPPVRGPNDNVMETHGSVIFPIALGTADDFQIFLINFFIVSTMLPYEVILTWGECQAAVLPSPPC
jgi:hypothetical protein